jgi:hypothetical protein
MKKADEIITKLEELTIKNENLNISEWSPLSIERIDDIATHIERLRKIANHMGIESDRYQAELRRRKR